MLTLGRKYIHVYISKKKILSHKNCFIQNCIYLEVKVFYFSFTLVILETFLACWTDPKFLKNFVKDAVLRVGFKTRFGLVWLTN